MSSDINQFTSQFKNLEFENPATISKLDMIVQRSTFIDPEDQGHYWLKLALWFKELPVTDIVLIMKLLSQSENSNKKLPIQDEWLIIHALLQLAEKSKLDNVVEFKGIQETLKLFITTNDILLNNDDREEIESVFEDYFK